MKRTWYPLFGLAIIGYLAAVFYVTRLEFWPFGLLLSLPLVACAVLLVKAVVRPVRNKANDHQDKKSEELT